MIRQARSGGVGSAELLEPLECRVCLSTLHFSGPVMMTYHQTTGSEVPPSAVVAWYDEGVIHDLSYGSYVGYQAANGGRESLGDPYDFRNVQLLDDGRWTADGELLDLPGTLTLTDQDQMFFSEAHGFPMGIGSELYNWSIEGESLDLRIGALLFETPNDFLIERAYGSWNLYGIEQGPGEPAAGRLLFGTLDIQSDSVRITKEYPNGQFRITTTEVASWNPAGRITLVDGTWIQVGPSSDVAGAVEFNSDDTAFAGLLVKPDIHTTAWDVAGTYRTAAWTNTGSSQGRSLIGLGWDVLDLNVGGTFRVLETSAFNNGAESITASGSWFIAGDGDVVLDDGAGTQLHLDSAASGRVLATRSGDSISYAVKIPGTGPQVVATVAPGTNLSGTDVAGRLRIVTENSEGRPVVFTELDGGGWEVADLAGEAGSAVPTSGATAWTDSKDGLAYAAAASDGGLLLFRESDEGEWTVRNLSLEPLIYNYLVGELTSFVNKQGIVHLAGMDADGNLLLFQQTGGRIGEEYAWVGRNLSVTDLSAQGQQTPAFVSGLTSFVTAWNALNIVGLDADGNIQAVWTAGGMSQWRVDNLSEITGAPLLTGDLTAYLTTWQGINLAGTDATGALSVTWWVPQFKGNWVTSNLTELFDGPRLETGSLTSWVTDWGGLNVAGLDFGGQIVAYWWAPGMKEQFGSDRWAVAQISRQFDMSYSPTGPLQGVSAAANKSMNILASSHSSDLLRYWWSPGDPWQMESLTASV